MTRAGNRSSAVVPIIVSLLLRRLLLALLIVGGATVASFLLLRAAPGDPLRMATESRGYSTATRDILRARHGLDRTTGAQLQDYLTRLARGDFGQSISEQRAVADVLAEALPATLLLSGSALTLAVLLGVVAGTIQGWRPNDRLASLTGTVLTMFYTLPEVVVGIALVAVLGLRWRWFPVTGMMDPMVDLTGRGIDRLLDQVWHLGLPSIVLALSWGAAIARQQQVAVREIAGESFVRTARAKGLRGRSVLSMHVLRPALPSTVAVIGTMLPVLVGGTVIVESLFAWPGMGSLIVQAVGSRDYPLVAGAVVVVASATALGTLATDILVLWLDPRRRGVRA